MIVKILKNPINIIKPETNLEVMLLQSDGLHSKLAFQMTKGLQEPGLVVRLNAQNDMPITYSGASVEISADKDNIKWLSYLLRVTLDANCINCSCLPLHAAYFQSKTKGILLAADTDHGKSLIFNEYAIRPSCEPIGDDHIIMREGLIAGNQVSRIRQKYAEQIYKPINSVPQQMKPYTIVVVELSAQDCLKEVSKDQMTLDKRFNQPLLKYLVREIIDGDCIYKPRDIFGMDIMNNYFLKYSEFVNNAERILKLSGSPEFIKLELDKVAA